MDKTEKREKWKGGLEEKKEEKQSTGQERRNNNRKSKYKTKIQDTIRMHQIERQLKQRSSKL
jgi:hypothetical protein